MPRKDLIQVRRDTSANWTSVNPILAAGELGYETNTGKLKIGDGIKTWNTLPYGSGATTISDNAPTSPNAGDQWFESDTNKLYVYYNSSWVWVAGSLLDNVVTITKINDGAVTNSKIASGTIQADRLASGVLKPQEATFTIPGTLATGVRGARFYVEDSRTISNVVASVGTYPTGSSVIFDVYKNGTTIFTTQANRPTIPASGFYDGSSVPNVTSLVAGDYLTIGVSQVGSSTRGADAVIRVVFS